MGDQRTGAALDSLLLSRAERAPRARFLELAELDHAVSLEEFVELTARTASVLAAHGVGPGGRVAVWAENGLAWLLLQFAAAWRGAALVALNPAATESEIRMALRRSGADLLFADREVRGRSTAALLASLNQELALGRCLPLADRLGRGAFTGLRGWDDDPPKPQERPDAVVNIQFTSGSTGSPKMVGLSSRALIANARATASAAKFAAGDVIASPLPLSHAAGLSSGAVLSLVTGSTWVSARRFDADTVLTQIERHRCNALQAVPTMVDMVMERLAQGPARDISSLRMAFLGGAPVAAKLRARVRSSLQLERVVVAYGQTEAGPTISVDPGDGSCLPLDATEGRVVGDLSVMILDPATGHPCPTGKEGEIVVSGANLATGYIDDPEASAATFTPAGLVTGDLGRLSADGVLRVTGRVKDMIIRGGENVSPVEVEAAIIGLPGVSQVCVVGSPSNKWGEEVAALIVPTEVGALDPDRVRGILLEKLARHKVPTQLHVVSGLPLLPSGKMDRVAARQMLKEVART